MANAHETFIIESYFTTMLVLLYATSDIWYNFAMSIINLLRNLYKRESNCTVISILDNSHQLM